MGEQRLIFLTNILFSLRTQTYPEDSCNSLRTLRQSSFRFNLEQISVEHINSVVNNLNLNKSVGYDNISAKAIYNCNDILAPVLTCILNKIINSSIYPDCLKISKIVPIPKVANASEASDFRPVSLLPIIDKIFEKIIHERLFSYLDSNNLMYKYQFGFRKGCNTEEVVLNAVNFICDKLDRGSSGVAGLFLDFSKAFDLVDHDIMLRKLMFYGIMGKELRLFENFLRNRKQFVQIGEEKSNMLDVQSGVPQGSCLGPLLFSIYLNDLSNLQLTGKLYMFADDVCLFYPYKYDLVLKTYMERDVALILEYVRLNRLKLNADKTKLIRFRPCTRVQDNSFAIQVGENLILETDRVKYLGIILQSNMAWNLHINEVKSRIAPAVGVLFKMKNKLNLKTKLMIYQSLIQSHINYMAIIYGFRNTSELKSLQVMQNRALKTIYNLPLRYPTLLLYRDICKNIMPFCGRYKYQLLIYMFKSIRNIGYRSVTFSQNQTLFNTRNQGNLHTARCRLETTRQRIEYIGSLEYNKLPLRLKSINSLSVFKKELRKYIFENLESLLCR